MNHKTISKGSTLLASLLLSGCLYQSLGKSPGAFLHPNKTGDYFVHISNDEWDTENNALFYFYRNQSIWADDELEAPSYYVDDKHYFNLRSGSWTWVEVKPGLREIDVRRPLLGLEGTNHFSLSRIADMEMIVEPGQIYYFRHDELVHPSKKHASYEDENELYAGDVQLVERETAMPEITRTRFLVSDLLAPNHAAVSIVEHNEEYDMKKQDTRTLWDKIKFWESPAKETSPTVDELDLDQPDIETETLDIGKYSAKNSYIEG